MYTVPKLTTAKLVNCQSHADSTFEFGPGLNVIKGPNNSGKSVFMKMLKIAGCPTIFDKEEREALIRDGAEFAMALYTFEDFSACAVKVFPKQATYHFTPDYRSVVFDASLTPDERAIRNLSLIVDQDSSFIANILDLDQSLLFVKSTETTNHNMVKLLTEHRRLRRLLEVTEVKSKEFKAHIKEVTDIVLNLDIKLSQHQYIDTRNLEDRITNMEAGIKAQEILLEVCREVENSDKHIVEFIDYDMLIKLCDLCIDIRKYLEDSNAVVEEFDDKAIDSVDVYESLLKVKELAEVEPFKDESSILFAFETILQGAEIASSITVTEEFDDTVMKVVDFFENLTKAEHQSKMLHNYISDLSKGEEEVEQLMEEISKLGTRMTCPICGEVQHIDGQCIPINN